LASAPNTIEVVKIIVPTRIVFNRNKLIFYSKGCLKVIMVFPLGGKIDCFNNKNNKKIKVV